MELFLSVIFLLIYAAVGYGLIAYSLRRETVSKYSIFFSYFIGCLGLFPLCVKFAEGDAFDDGVGGFFWTAVFLAKGTIELVRYRKLRRGEWPAAGSGAGEPVDKP